MQEWILNAAIGLMIGALFGMVVGLKYIITMDRKIEKLLEKVERIEIKTEREVERALKIKKRRR